MRQWDACEQWEVKHDYPVERTCLTCDRLDVCAVFAERVDEFISTLPRPNLDLSELKEALHELD